MIAGDRDTAQSQSQSPAPSLAPADPYTHDLAVAQLEAMAAAVERLHRAVERLGASVADLEAAPVPALAVAPGQLRLVLNG